MVVCLEGSPISTELCGTIGFLVTSPTKALVPRLLRFDQEASSRSLGGSKLLPFENDGGHCVLWDLQCCRSFYFSYRKFLRPHGLVFALACSVNCGNVYRQVCSFPNQVQSIEFTTDGHQSSCRNISRMIYGNRMHLSSISSLIAKRLNTHVMLRHYGLLCVD